MAPLAEIEDDDAAVLTEVDEQPAPAAKAASASSGPAAATAPAKPARETSALAVTQEEILLNTHERHCQPFLHFWFPRMKKQRQC